MAGFTNIKIEHELRLCEVNGKLGYFHCWDHYSNPVPASLVRGGPPAGVISFTQAIVEFPEGIGYASPANLKFCDEKHEFLVDYEKWRKERTND